MLWLRMAAAWAGVLDNKSISLILSGSIVGWQASYEGGGAEAVATGDEAAVTTRDDVA